MNISHNKTTLLVRDLAINMYIGIYDEEKDQKQPVILNIEATLLNRSAHSSIFNDKIESTLSYEILIRHARRIAGLRHYDLVETFGNTLCDFFLKAYPMESIVIDIQKPEAVRDAVVGVRITKCAHKSMNYSK